MKNTCNNHTNNSIIFVVILIYNLFEFFHVEFPSYHCPNEPH